MTPSENKKLTKDQQTCQWCIDEGKWVAVLCVFCDSHKGCKTRKKMKKSEGES